MPEPVAELELDQPVQESEVDKNPQIFFNPYSNKPEWDFDFKGLSFRVEPTWKEHKVIYNDKGIKDLYIPKGTIVAHGGFLPFHKAEFIPGTRKSTIILGIEALDKFFDSIGQPDSNYPDNPLPDPKFIIGITNERMAKALQKLGFLIVTPFGKIGFGRIEALTDEEFEVIGRTNEVKDKLHSLKPRFT